MRYPCGIVSMARLKGAAAPVQGRGVTAPFFMLSQKLIVIHGIKNNI